MDMKVDLTAIKSKEAVDSIDYKEKINMFLDMEKLKLVNEAVAAGLSEAAVLEAMEEENFIDFDLTHLKVIMKQREKDALKSQADATTKETE